MGANLGAQQFGARGSAMKEERPHLAFLEKTVKGQKIGEKISDVMQLRIESRDRSVQAREGKKKSQPEKVGIRGWTTNDLPIMSGMKRRSGDCSIVGEGPKVLHQEQGKQNIRGRKPKWTSVSNTCSTQNIGTVRRKSKTKFAGPKMLTEGLSGECEY